MKKLIYLFLTVLIVGCSDDDGNNNQDNNDGDNNQSSCNGDTLVYLADNGVTIKACDDANVGDTGVINGVTYTVVDEGMLREMVEYNEEDVTKVATTKVTDMSSMFSSAYVFNQPIGNWDVSNVTDMTAMFQGNEAFNQPIGNWDVSSVTDMLNMFNAAVFNQDISNWDVSNVTDMEQMFINATSYNQDLSSWNVGGVNVCDSFSNNTPSWTLPKPNFTNCDPN